jgi:3-oxoacyl-[acyl-carrier protein] reductase
LKSWENMSESIDLSGRVAVVTGASRGIGAAIARTLAAHGAHLILHARAPSDALNIVAEQAGTDGAAAHFVTGDVSDPATADAIGKAAFSKTKRLDIWVNNAGQLQESMIGMTQPAAMQAVVAANLNSVLYSIQAAARLMRRNGGGSIINMSSIMGRFGQSGIMSYSASKAGVIGASMAAAKELAPLGIRVNVLAPGFVETDMTARMTDAARAEKLAAIPMGRAGQPEEVADAALFLASDLSRYITGQVIGIDGGMIV